MKKTTGISLVLAAFISLATATAASADSWNMVGTACQPIPEDIQADAYARTGAGITHKGTNINLVRVRCPVTAPKSGFAPTKLGMTYLDSTGYGYSGEIVAVYLYKTSKTSASNTILAQVMSSNFLETVLTFNEVSFSHTFDFANNYYWVEAQLDRTNTSQSMIFYGVMLSE